MATRTTKKTTKTTSTRSTAKPKTRTTSTKSATAKTTRAPAAAKPAPKSAPVVVDTPQPVVAGPVMRKKELVDAVVARSGIKKKFAKPAVEMALALLGEAMQSGRALDMQPMGKIKVKREKKLSSGKMLVARIRQSQDLPQSEPAPSVDDGPKTGAVSDPEKTAAE